MGCSLQCLLLVQSMGSRRADFSNCGPQFSCQHVESSHTRDEYTSPALAGRWNATGMPGKSWLLNKWKILNITPNEINQNYNYSEYTFLPIILVSTPLLGSIFSCLSRTLFQKFSLLSPYLFLSIYKHVISPIFKRIPQIFETPLHIGTCHNFWCRGNPKSESRLLHMKKAGLACWEHNSADCQHWLPGKWVKAS